MNTKPTTRRALLGGAVAASTAVALPAMASAGNAAVRPEFRAAFDRALAARSHASALVDRVADLEEIKFDDRARWSRSQEAELDRAEDAVTAGWDAWGEAVEELLAIPARSIAEVEMKFTAAADHDDEPETFRPSDAYQTGFGMIWADLRALAGATA